MEKKIDPAEKELYKKEGFVIEGIPFKISKDDMLIYVEGNPDDQVLQTLLKENWEKIKGELKKRGFAGILENPEIKDGKIIIARGTFPTSPIPEHLELTEKFLPLIKGIDCRKALLESEEIKKLDPEDLRELCKKIICAREGEVIARWFPAKKGKPGRNVWGESIPPPDLPEEKPFSLGENVVLDKEKKVLIAKESGVVKIEDNGHIEIYPEYTIEEDVDFYVGNVYFTGKKLTIKGDIKFGFKVICEGELELEGATENKVYIEVKGNFFSKGIIRGENTELIVYGNAFLQGVEQASLKIFGNLEVKTALLFSDAFIKGDLFVIEEKGVVYGGTIKVEGNAEVKVLGNDTHTPTKIFVGHNPEVIDPYVSLNQKEMLIKETLKKLAYGITLGERLKKEGKLTPEKEKIWMKIKAQYEKNLEALKEVTEKLKELVTSLESLKDKSLIVWEKVYPGVSIGIVDTIYTIPEEKNGPIMFVLEADLIKEKKPDESIIKRKR